MGMSESLFCLPIAESSRSYLMKRFFAPVWVFNLGIFFSFRRKWSSSPQICPARQGLPCLTRPQPVYPNLRFPRSSRSGPS